MIFFPDMILASFVPLVIIAPLYVIYLLGYVSPRGFIYGGQIAIGIPLIVTLYSGYSISKILGFLVIGIPFILGDFVPISFMEYEMAPYNLVQEGLSETNLARFLPGFQRKNLRLNILHTTTGLRISFRSGYFQNGCPTWRVQ